MKTVCLNSRNGKSIPKSSNAYGKIKGIITTFKNLKYIFVLGTGPPCIKYMGGDTCEKGVVDFRDYWAMHCSCDKW